MIDLLFTNWLYVAIFVALMVIYYFWTKFRTTFFGSGPKVTLKSSLREGDILYDRMGMRYTYTKFFNSGDYDKDLHHYMYDELDIVEIIRSR